MSATLMESRLDPAIGDRDADGTEAVFGHDEIVGKVVLVFCRGDGALRIITLSVSNFSLFVGACSRWIIARVPSG